MESSDLFAPPPRDYFLEHPDHWWPAWKFGMKLDDLFTTLPREFNSIALPILDTDAFSRDISEISCIAQDRQEFVRLLAERRDSRQEELWKIWLYTFRRIASSPRLIDESSGNWDDAMHIYHSKSFDSYVRYFAGFLPSVEPATYTTSNHKLLSAESATTGTTSREDTVRSEPSTTPPSMPILKKKAPYLPTCRSSTAKHYETKIRFGRVRKAVDVEDQGYRRSSRIKQRNKRVVGSGPLTRSKTSQAR